MNERTGRVFFSAQRKKGGRDVGILSGNSRSPGSRSPSVEAFHLGNCIILHRAIHSTLARETRALQWRFTHSVSLTLADEKEWAYERDGWRSKAKVSKKDIKSTYSVITRHHATISDIAAIFRINVQLCEAEIRANEIALWCLATHQNKNQNHVIDLSNAKNWLINQPG